MLSGLPKLVIGDYNQNAAEMRATNPRQCGCGSSGDFAAGEIAAVLERPSLAGELEEELGCASRELRPQRDIEPR